MNDRRLASTPDLPQLAGPSGPESGTLQAQAAEATPPDDLRRLNELPVRVTAIVGRARMEIGSLLALIPGEIIELDRKVGEAIDILVNDRLIARGQVVMVGDRLGVTMTEIFKADS